MYEQVHQKFFSRLIRLISASWAQKRLIPTFWTRCTSSAWKIFISPIRASWWVLDSFRPPEPKHDWFLLSRDDVRQVREKIFFYADSSELLAVKLISASWAEKRLIPTFWDKVYVECMKNFHLADSRELMGVRLISSSWAQTRLIPYFLDMMYVELMKNFLLADSIELLAVRLILGSWA